MLEPAMKVPITEGLECKPVVKVEMTITAGSVVDTKI
jgi:hypothetical protein